MTHRFVAIIADITMKSGSFHLGNCISIALLALSVPLCIPINLAFAQQAAQGSVTATTDASKSEVGEGGVTQSQTTQTCTEKREKKIPDKNCGITTYTKGDGTKVTCANSKESPAALAGVPVCSNEEVQQALDRSPGWSGQAQPTQSEPDTNTNQPADQAYQDIFNDKGELLLSAKEQQAAFDTAGKELSEIADYVGKPDSVIPASIRNNPLFQQMNEMARPLDFSVTPGDFRALDAARGITSPDWLNRASANIANQSLGSLNPATPYYTPQGNVSSFGEARPDLYESQGSGNVIGNALVSAQEAAANAWQAVKEYSAAAWEKTMAALTPTDETLPGAGLPDSPNMTPEQELPGIEVVQTPDVPVTGLPQNVTELAEMLDSPQVAEQVRSGYVNEILGSKDQGWTPSSDQYKEAIGIVESTPDDRGAFARTMDRFVNYSERAQTLARLNSGLQEASRAEALGILSSNASALGANGQMAALPEFSDAAVQELLAQNPEGARVAAASQRANDKALALQSTSANLKEIAGNAIDIRDQLQARVAQLAALEAMGVRDIPEGDVNSLLRETSDQLKTVNSNLERMLDGSDPAFEKQMYDAVQARAQVNEMFGFGTLLYKPVFGGEAGLRDLGLFISDPAAWRESVIANATAQIVTQSVDQANAWTVAGGLAGALPVSAVMGKTAGIAIAGNPLGSAFDGAAAAGRAMKGFVNDAAVSAWADDLDIAATRPNMDFNPTFIDELSGAESRFASTYARGAREAVQAEVSSKVIAPEAFERTVYNRLHNSMSKTDYVTSGNGRNVMDALESEMRARGIVPDAGFTPSSRPVVVPDGGSPAPLATNRAPSVYSQPASRSPFSTSPRAASEIPPVAAGLPSAGMSAPIAAFTSLPTRFSQALSNVGDAMQGAVQSVRRVAAPVALSVGMLTNPLPPIPVAGIDVPIVSSVTPAQGAPAAQSSLPKTVEIDGIKGVETGAASTYNPAKPGWRTGGTKLATGGRYNPKAYEAALQTDLAAKYQMGHGKYPQNGFALVEQGDKKLIVKINDNGPLVPGRIIDLNEASMRYLSNNKYGNNSGVLGDVKVTVLEGTGYTPGPVAGDASLVARADTAAPPQVTPTQVAETRPAPTVVEQVQQVLGDVGAGILTAAREPVQTVDDAVRSWMGNDVTPSGAQTPNEPSVIDPNNARIASTPGSSPVPEGGPCVDARFCRTGAILDSGLPTLADANMEVRPVRTVTKGTVQVPVAIKQVPFNGENYTVQMWYMNDVWTGRGYKGTVRTPAQRELLVFHETRVAGTDDPFRIAESNARGGRGNNVYVSAYLGKTRVSPAGEKVVDIVVLAPFDEFSNHAKVWGQRGVGIETAMQTGEVADSGQVLASLIMTDAARAWNPNIRIVNHQQGEADALAGFSTLREAGLGERSGGLPVPASVDPAKKQLAERERAATKMVVSAKNLNTGISNLDVAAALKNAGFEDTRAYRAYQTATAKNIAGRGDMGREASVSEIALADAAIAQRVEAIRANPPATQIAQVPELLENPRIAQDLGVGTSPFAADPTQGRAPVTVALKDRGIASIGRKIAEPATDIPNALVETAFNRSSPFNVRPSDSVEQIVRDFTTPSAFDTPSAPVLVGESAPAARPTVPTQVVSNDVSTGISKWLSDRLDNAGTYIRTAFGGPTVPESPRVVTNTPSSGQVVASNEPGAPVRTPENAEVLPSPTGQTLEPVAPTVLAESRPLAITRVPLTEGEVLRPTTPTSIALNPSNRLGNEIVQVAERPVQIASKTVRVEDISGADATAVASADVKGALAGVEAAEARAVAAKVFLKELDTSKALADNVNRLMSAYFNQGKVLDPQSLSSAIQKSVAQVNRFERALADAEVVGALDAATAARVRELFEPVKSTSQLLETQRPQLMRLVPNSHGKVSLGATFGVDGAAEGLQAIKTTPARLSASLAERQALETAARSGAEKTIAAADAARAEAKRIAEAEQLRLVEQAKIAEARAAQIVNQQGPVAYVPSATPGTWTSADALAAPKGPFEVSITRVSDTPNTPQGPVDLPGQEPGVPSGRTPTIAREEEIDPALNPPPIPRTDPVLPFPENTGAVSNGEVSPTLTTDGGPITPAMANEGLIARTRDALSDAFARARFNAEVGWSRLTGSGRPAEVAAPLNDSFAQRLDAWSRSEGARLERMQELATLREALQARQEIVARNAADLAAATPEPQSGIPTVRDTELASMNKEMSTALTRGDESIQDLVRAEEALARNTPEGDAEARALAASGLDNVREQAAAESRALAIARANAEVPADDMIGRLGQWDARYGGATQATNDGGSGGAGGTGGSGAAAQGGENPSLGQRFSRWFCAQGGWRTGVCGAIGLTTGVAINQEIRSGRENQQNQQPFNPGSTDVPGSVISTSGTQPGGVQAQPAPVEGGAPQPDGSSAPSGQPSVPPAGDGQVPGGYVPSSGGQGGSGSGAPIAYGGYGPASIGGSGGGFFGGGMNMLSGLFQGLMQWFSGGEEEDTQSQPQQPSQPTPEPPVGAIVGNPQIVNAGDATTLSWSTVGTDVSSSTCAVVTADFAVFTRGSQNGSISSGALSESTRFGLVCNVKGAQDKLLNETLIRVRGDDTDPPRIFTDEQIAESQASQSNPVRPTSQNSSTQQGSNDGSSNNPTPQDVRTCDPEQAMDSFIKCLCEAEPNPRGCSVPPGGTR